MQISESDLLCNETLDDDSYRQPFSVAAMHDCLPLPPRPPVIIEYPLPPGIRPGCRPISCLPEFARFATKRRKLLSGRDDIIQVLQYRTLPRDIVYEITRFIVFDVGTLGPADVTDGGMSFLRRVHGYFKTDVTRSIRLFLFHFYFTEEEWMQILPIRMLGFFFQHRLPLWVDPYSGDELPASVLRRYRSLEILSPGLIVYEKMQLLPLIEAPGDSDSPCPWTSGMIRPLLDTSFFLSLAPIGSTEPYVPMSTPETPFPFRDILTLLSSVQLSCLRRLEISFSKNDRRPFFHPTGDSDLIHGRLMHLCIANCLPCISFRVANLPSLRSLSLRDSGAGEEYTSLSEMQFRNIAEHRLLRDVTFCHLDLTHEAFAGVCFAPFLRRFRIFNCRFPYVGFRCFSPRLSLGRRISPNLGLFHVEDCTDTSQIVDYLRFFPQYDPRTLAYFARCHTPESKLNLGKEMMKFIVSRRIYETLGSEASCRIDFEGKVFHRQMQAELDRVDAKEE